MTVLRFKSGVLAFGLQPEMLWAADRGVGVWSKHGIAYFTITSARGDKHGAGSYHPLGLAIDVRTRGLSADTILTLVDDLRAALGTDYDVVLESDHIHIEYQPKEAYTYLTVRAK